MSEKEPNGVHVEIKKYKKHRRNQQHRTLTEKDVPRRVNGQKLGRKKRFELMENISSENN